MKYIWFLYLKKFGYAFLDEADATATPTGLTGECSIRAPKSKKRTRFDLDNEVPTPKRPRVAKSLRKKVLSSETSKGKSTSVFDEFPEDSILFDCSQDSILEGAMQEDEELSPCPDDNRVGATDSPTPGGVGEKITSGNDLYLLQRAKRQLKVQYFSVKFTIGLLYLGLLYTHQKILPSDLVRLDTQTK